MKNHLEIKEEWKIKWREKVHAWQALMWNRPVKQWIFHAFLLNLIIEIGNQRTIPRLLRYVFGNPLVFLYNMLLLMVPLALAFLFKRRDFVHALMCILCLLLGVTNGVMLSCRVTPFNATDFRLARFGFSLITRYLDWWMIIALAAAIILLVVLLVFLYIRLPKRRLPMHRLKLAVLWCVFLFFVSVVTQVMTMSGLVSTKFPNLQQAYRDYGMPYCFTCSVVNTGIQKPEDYAQNVVDDIMEEIDGTEPDPSEGASSEPGELPSDPEETEPEAMPNIIFVQLESFFDITQMKNLTFNRDPLSNFHRLMNRYSSGYVSVPSVGAGTANTEFEMITGMNLDFFGPGEYPYKTILQTSTCESMAYVLRPLGYTSHALHNNTATFYDRNLVFSQLGFDDFTSLEYMNQIHYTETGWAKDEILTSQIKDILDSTEGSDYIYTISVQGHGKYPDEPILENPYVTIEGIEDESLLNEFTYYVNQVYEMDQFVGALVRSLESRGEDFVLVMYGDHLPTLGIEDEDLNGTDIFQTPYFIGTNMDLPRQVRNLESYQMGAWVLEMLDIHQGIIPKLHQAFFDMDMDAEASEDALPHIDSIPVEEAEKIVTNRDVYLYWMQVLSYDLLYGDHTVTDGENPYIATDLKFGVKQISVDMLTASTDGNLYVGGWNFTPSSVIYNKGKPLDTVYQSPWLLSADISGVERGDRLEISVVQYAAEDHLELSSTPSYPIVVTEREERRIINGEEGDPFYHNEEEAETAEETGTEAETDTEE